MVILSTGPSQPVADTDPTTLSGQPSEKVFLCTIAGPNDHTDQGPR
jgi:hypothetical protein